MPVLSQALIPVFLVIAIGCAARVSGALPRSAWDGFDQITYYILFPALIGSTLAMTDLNSVPLARMGSAMALAVIGMAVLLILAQPLMARWAGVSGPAFCSIFQGSTRWNSFVGIALAADLFGKQGLALSAVGALAMIPLLNVLAVLVHARFASAVKVSAAKLAITMIKNPFIWSTLLGLAWNIGGLPMPKAGAMTLDIIGRAALGAGLLCVGAGLDLARIRHAGWPLALGVLPRLLLMPILAAILARLCGVSGAAYTVTIICAAVPTASGSYLLARQMGGDHALMAEILTVQTVLSALTIPLALAILS